MSTEIWIVHRMDLDDPESYIVPEVACTTEQDATTFMEALRAMDQNARNIDYFVEAASLLNCSDTADAVDEMRRVAERLKARRK